MRGNVIHAMWYALKLSVHDLWCIVISSFKYDIIILLILGANTIFNMSISIRTTFYWGDMSLFFSTISSKINGKDVIKHNISDAELLSLYNH